MKRMSVAIICVAALLVGDAASGAQRFSTTVTEAQIHTDTVTGNIEVEEGAPTRCLDGRTVVAFQKKGKKKPKLGSGETLPGSGDFAFFVDPPNPELGDVLLKVKKREIGPRIICDPTTVTLPV
jgi:hypothetical protein